MSTRDLQDPLRQSQKMEAIGRLAGGVAHDFNTMLGVIIGYASVAQTHLDDPMKLRFDLEQIEEAARRSEALTRQLLAFARQEAIAPRLMDLDAHVARVASMFVRIVGPGIDLQVRPGGSPWPVLADPAQIDQVLANLVVNACDAMPAGGRIVVETGTVALDAAAASAHAVAPGDYVTLAVSDDGCGMDADAQERAFEPFFTTKPRGKGTGLGLATVYGIARQHGGGVRLESAPGQGTTVRLYFPRPHDAGESPRIRARHAEPTRDQPATT